MNPINKSVYQRKDRICMQTFNLNTVLKYQRMLFGPENLEKQYLNRSGKIHRKKPVPESLFE